MAVNGIEIKVGQKWETSGGEVVTIVSVNCDSSEFHNAHYTIAGDKCNGNGILKWTNNGKFDVDELDHRNNLVRLISKANESEKQHSHYFKDVSHLTYIDVYRVLELFNVTDPCLQHAVKKLLCAGGRGAKDFEKDVREAGDSITRKLEMMAEDAKKD